MSTSLGRTGLAAALFLAPWGFVVANASYAWATRDGDDSTGANALTLAAAHPTLLGAAALAGSRLLGRSSEAVAATPALAT
ncbi:hypothetical protein ACNTMW_12545 [Planosporangium sp. 12N6]|uniref:hypothetical protein n=1 Tax=Planosporangium spinosum TaxID=3402278 RepID=UPI003CEDD7DA